jgi:hypothetical protein
MGEGDQGRVTRARQSRIFRILKKWERSNEGHSSISQVERVSRSSEASSSKGPRDSPLLPHSRPGPETSHSFFHHRHLLLLLPHDCKRQQTLHGSFTAINHPDRQARMGRQAGGCQDPSPCPRPSLHLCYPQIPHSLAAPSHHPYRMPQSQPPPLHILTGGKTETENRRQRCSGPVLEVAVALGQERVKNHSSSVAAP